MSEKKLNKSGRGSFNCCTDVNSGLHLIRWLENGCVRCMSLRQPKPSRDGIVKRILMFHAQDAVQVYNEAMSGWI